MAPSGEPCGGGLRAWLDGCRCDDCTAMVDGLRVAAQRNHSPYGRLPVDLSLVGAEHGTVRGYSRFGCGCNRCREVYNRAQRARRDARRRTV